MASGGDQVLEDAIDQFQSMQDALKNLKKKGRILGQLHALMKDEKCMEKKDFFNHESEDDYYDEEDAWMYEGPSKPAGLFEKEQVTSDDDDTGVAQETDRKSAKRDRDGKQKAISSGTRSRRQSEEASKKAKKGPEDRSGDLKKVVKSETFHLNWSRGWLKTFALANWNCGGSLKATDYDLTKMKLEVAPSTHAKLSDAAQGKEDAATDGLNTEPENWTAFKDIPNLPIEKLLSVCCVAPFGDLLTGQTLIDPSVRTAFEAVFRFLPVYTDEELTKLAEEEAKKKKEPFYHRKVKKHSKPLFEEKIRKRVMNVLTNGQEVQLKPYKINVYGPGGKLLVSHGGKEHIFDFSVQSTQPVLQWAALFGDCYHQITEVTSGHRVTLTYNILRQEKEEKEVSYGWPYNTHFYPGETETISSSVARGSAQVPEKARLAFLDELDSLSIVGTKHLGILLSYKYGLSSLDPSRLKGCDKKLYDLVFAKWKCRLLPVVYQDHNTTEGPGDEYLCREGIDIFAFSKEDYLYLSGQAAKPRAIRGYQDMPFLWFEAECGSFLTESQKGGGYAGNESTGPDINKIYLHSALIIELCHPLE